jgi:hypothetical protein
MAITDVQSSAGQDGSVQSDIENALFGGPIAQEAPQLLDLAASSQMGGIDYSFYTNPESQPIQGGYTDLSTGDPYNDYLSQLPPVDLAQFDVSDSGAYVNPDGSISMP